jgi:hypothetical protein
MEPTQKSPAIDAFISSVAGRDRGATIRSNVCIFCGQPVTNFRNDISRREYAISGLCQKCQDETFGND